MKKLIGKIKNFFNGKLLISLSPRQKKTNKVIKYSFCIGLPLIGAILGCTIGISEYNKKKEIKPEIVVELKKDEINRRVYLISNDNLTIPLSVSLEKKSTLQEQIIDVYNLLKVNSQIENPYIKGFIPQETKLNKVNIENKILQLDFSDNILNNNFNTNKTLEALTMSFISFDEIKGLEVFVNGTKINDIVDEYIPDILNEDYGINENYNFTSSILGKDKQIVFYSRNYSDEYKYLVPVTVYTDKFESVNQMFVNATKMEQPVSSHLKQLELYKSLDSQQSEIEHSYIVTTSALIDEDCVNKELFDLISLSYDLMGIEEKVSFVLEGETIRVDGIYKEEDSLVSNIIYNSVKI